MDWLKKAGFGLSKALGSTVALELLSTIAKSQSDLPKEVVEGAKLGLQLLVLYRLAFNNPDGTPVKDSYIDPKLTNAKGK